jgi:DNA mismatch repair protein MutS
LLILDEIGRGTSTYDGLSIARAVVEEIHDRIGARTLFATHFHELASLAEELRRVQVYNAAVIEDHHEVVFLRQIRPGAADRSYGIHVARLAGLPGSVTARAEAILRGLETTLAGRQDRSGSAHIPSRHQLALDGFGVAPHAPDEALVELLSLDLNRVTPIELAVRVHELQRRAGLA